MTAFMFVLVLALQQPAPLDSANARIDAQTREVASTLRCPVCQGLSIQDSPAPLAREMRGVAREQLAAGRTPDEVRAYFVSKYGEVVLLQPAARGFNLTVYVLPVVALLAGVLLLVRLTRKWSRQGESLMGTD